MSPAAGGVNLTINGLPSKCLGWRNREGRIGLGSPLLNIKFCLNKFKQHNCYWVHNESKSFNE